MADFTTQDSLNPTDNSGGTINPSDGGGIRILGASNNVTVFVIVDNLGLSQTQNPVFVPDPHHVTLASSITVAQAIAEESVYQDGDTVTVSHQIVTGVDVQRTLNTDELNITQSVTGILVYKNRNSGQGGSSFLDPAAKIAYNNLAPAKTVTLSYSGTTITLRAPDWGDRDKYEVVRVQEETRGRSLIVYQDSMWPKTETLNLTFSYMLQTDVDSLLDFLVSSIGRTVTYVDHFGRTWKGYILNPDAEVHQPSRSNRTITIEFQGVLQ